MATVEILLIDIGNSFIKFATITEKTEIQIESINQPFDKIQRINHQSKDYLKQFENALSDKKISRVLMVSVAASKRIKKQLLDYFSLQPKSQPIISYARSQSVFERPEFQLINGYKNPLQLGLDRWLSMIATLYLSKLNSSQSTLPTPNYFAVIDFGSVISIDFIKNDKKAVSTYQHLGGILIPGYELNHQSLSKKMPVNQISSISKTLFIQEFGNTTESCIETGFFQGLKSILDNHPMIQKSQKIYLTGGFLTPFNQVYDFKSPKFETHPYLVLLGLFLQLNSNQ